MIRYPVKPRHQRPRYRDSFKRDLIGFIIAVIFVLAWFALLGLFDSK